MSNCFIASVLADTAGEEITRPPCGYSNIGAGARYADLSANVNKELQAYELSRNV